MTGAFVGDAVADLRAAVSLLTRIPVGTSRTPPTARAVGAYSLVGGLIGVVAGGLYAGLHAAAMSGPVAALLTVAGMVLLTGALHEDGLADTADGFGGGMTRARKLEIMRDSRIGSFGGLALILSVALRASAIAVIGAPAHVAASLIVTGAGARAAMVVPLIVLAPARTDGLAAGLGPPSATTVIAAAALAVLLALALLPWPAAVAACGAAAVVTGAMIRLARAQIGGHTGDVLGAVEQLAECAMLCVLSRSWS